MQKNHKKERGMNVKKSRILSLFLISAAAIALIGCGSKKDENIITVGVSPIPHKEIIEQTRDILKEEGYTLEVKEFSDYVTPNTALEEGEIDANYFQHIAYLNETNESKGYSLVYTAKVHLEPMAIYSKTVGSVNDIKDGSTIGIPNDPSNEARALRLLEKAGLITLKEGELVTPKDITENKLNLNFKELEAAQLPRVLEEVECAVINGNYAMISGLDANKDGIFVEDVDDESIKNNVNILAVREEDKDKDKIKALTKAINSDKVKNFIEEKYSGTIIPVFE